MDRKSRITFDTSPKIIKLKVVGNSMQPTIRNGDIVIVNVIPYSDFQIGDIIAFWRNPRNIVVHRIVSRDYKRKQVITKGDGNWSIDYPVKPKAILGKVFSIEDCYRRKKESRLIWKGYNFLLTVLNISYSKIVGFWGLKNIINVMERKLKHGKTKI